MNAPQENSLAKAVPEAVIAAEPKVSLDDFKKFKLVVAQIKEVKEHPNADKLYVMQVDTGKDVRQIVAGIRKAYTPDQLVGRRVMLIANLEPAVIRGEASHGMLLAASDECGTCLLGLERDLALGSIIK